MPKVIQLNDRKLGLNLALLFLQRVITPTYISLNRFGVKYVIGLRMPFKIN